MASLLETYGKLRLANALEHVRLPAGLVLSASVEFVPDALRYRNVDAAGLAGVPCVTIRSSSDFAPLYLPIDQLEELGNGDLAADLVQWVNVCRAAP